MSSDDNSNIDPFSTIATHVLREGSQALNQVGYGASVGTGASFEIPNIDDLLSITGIGPLDSAVTANFWGVRRNAKPLAQPLLFENTGMTFFTKPRMCLSDANILGTVLTLLHSENSKSMGRAIRAYLDPYTGGTPPNTATVSRGMKIDVYKSDLVDPLNPFITILGNNCMSITGFPDSDLNTYTAPEGVFHESWSMADDIVTLYGRYDLSCTFRNIYGDPIGAMMYAWLYYMSSVYVGDMMPYIDSIIDNEIDYQTRIYRFVMDPTRTRIVRMFCCGAAFPTAASTGANFNFNEGKPFVDESNEYSVNFTCSGAVYYDARIIKWFNKTVSNFNSNMADGKRESFYTKIPYGKLHTMDNMGYPWINADTMELEWWLDKGVYNSLLARGY